jgi:hypothetical protein
MVDDVYIAGGADYSQNFESVGIGSMPINWRFLYSSDGYNYGGEVVADGVDHVWRQWSERYAKFDYAPSPYPDWKEYSFSASVKTVNLPTGTKWRMSVYNYPMHDTAYETYRLEVNADGKIYLRKGGATLDSKTFTEIGLSPSEWNTYEISTCQSNVTSWELY